MRQHDLERAEADIREQSSQQAAFAPGGDEEPEQMRHLYIQDTTLEKVAEIHAQENVLGLLSDQDELAAWVAGLTRYGGSDSGDRPRWLVLEW